MKPFGAVMGAAVLAACGGISGSGAPVTTVAGVEGGSEPAVGPEPVSGGGENTGSVDECITLCSTSGGEVTLSCPAMVESVQTSGACTWSGPPCIGKDGGLCALLNVALKPTQAGTCHVVVTLEDGTQYAADVTFVQMPATDCCSAYLSQTQNTSVEIPPSACMVPGWEAGADATTDGEVTGEAGVGKDSEAGGEAGAGDGAG